MSKPQPGYYRTLLASTPDVRIAFTDKPIINCTKIDDTKTIMTLENSLDPYAQYYIDGLRSGKMCVIVENKFTNAGNDHFVPGQLYFKY